MRLLHNPILLPCILLLAIAAAGCNLSGRLPADVPPGSNPPTASEAGPMITLPARKTAPPLVVSTTAGADCPTPAGLKASVCAPGSSQATGIPTSELIADLRGPGSPPSATPAPATPLPLPSPTPCSPDLCVIASPFVFARPIAPPGRDSIDLSYRFGSTQDRQRDPHYGVEFLNPHGTPVLAAGNGIIVVAGDDRKTFYGPYSYFYGNLVVVQHDLPALSQPVYTLYGHLSEILVKEGERVNTGQEIGRVGMSGVATGSHLHFEVRLGENTYQSSRNPELWLAPHMDKDGRSMGALAGRILDPQGKSVSVPGIVLEHLPTPDQPADEEFYVDSYEEKILLGQPPYGESFATGDIPAGWYRITFAWSGLQQQVVQVFPGQLTLVTFQVGY